MGFLEFRILSSAVAPLASSAGLEFGWNPAFKSLQPSPSGIFPFEQERERWMAHCASPKKRETETDGARQAEDSKAYLAVTPIAP